MTQDYRFMDFKAVLDSLKEKGVKSSHMTLGKCNDDLNRETDNWKATLTVKDGAKIKNIAEKFDAYNDYNYPSALKFAQKVVELLAEKGVKIIDISVYKCKSYRRLEKWVFKLKTENNIGVQVVFDLKMYIPSIANTIYNMIIEEENNMCYSSLFNDGRSHAQLIVNKANGEANRILIQEGLISSKNNKEGIFINALDYDEVIDDWFVDIVHQYEGAVKHFKYHVSENVEDLTLKMVNGWKQDKGLI